MTGTIMNRKAAEFWWNEIAKRNIDIPKDAAYFERDDFTEKWNITTWEEIHKLRTDKILYNITEKRKCEQIKPCLIWVFSHGYWLMGGYYTIVKTIDKEFYLNFRGEGISRWASQEYLQTRVMQSFPYYFPITDFFYDWMIEFVKKNRNNKFYAGWTNQGISKAVCRLDENGRLLDIAVNRSSLS